LGWMQSLVLLPIQLAILEALRRAMKWMWRMVTGKSELVRLAAAADAAGATGTSSSSTTTATTARNPQQQQQHEETVQKSGDALAAAGAKLESELAFIRALRRSHQLRDVAGMLGLEPLPPGAVAGGARGAAGIAEWLERVSEKNGALREAHLDAVMSIVVQRKRVSSHDVTTKRQLRHVLERVLSVGETVQTALLHRATPFSASNPLHEQMLAELWDKLTDRAPREGGRVTREWGRVGFQGTDPATDFRGGGELALRQLVFFANEYERDAKRFLCEPHNEIARYPFACCGIGVSDSIVRMASRGALDLVLLRAPSASRRMQALDDLYAAVWRAFHEMYVASAPATVMDFPPLYKHAITTFERELLARGHFDHLALAPPNSKPSKKD